MFIYIYIYIYIPSPTDIISIIVEQIPYPVGASVFLNKLIDDSKALLQTTATVEKVLYFKKLLLKYGRQPDFVSFFQAICSCKGEAIIKNQKLLLDELVLKQDVYKSIFIHTYTNPLDEISFKKWTVPIGDGENKDYLGQAEMEFGFRRVLYVS